LSIQRFHPIDTTRQREQQQNKLGTRVKKEKKRRRTQGGGRKTRQNKPPKHKNVFGLPEVTHRAKKQITSDVEPPHLVNVIVPEYLQLLAHSAVHV
jgi:hypothetical protein